MKAPLSRARWLSTRPKAQAHRPAVDQIGLDLGLGDAQVGNPGFNDGCHNVHPMPSGFLRDLHRSHDYSKRAHYSSSSTARKQSSTCCKITSGALSTKCARLAAQSMDFA